MAKIKVTRANYAEIAEQSKKYAEQKRNIEKNINELSNDITLRKAKLRKTPNDAGQNTLKEKINELNKSISEQKNLYNKMEKFVNSLDCSSFIQESETLVKMISNVDGGPPSKLMETYYKPEDYATRSRYENAGQTEETVKARKQTYNFADIVTAGLSLTNLIQGEKGQMAGSAGQDAEDKACENFIKTEHNDSYNQWVKKVLQLRSYLISVKNSTETLASKATHFEDEQDNLDKRHKDIGYLVSLLSGCLNTALNEEQEARQHCKNDNNLGSSKKMEAITYLDHKDKNDQDKKEEREAREPFDARLEKVLGKNMITTAISNFARFIYKQIHSTKENTAADQQISNLKQNKMKSEMLEQDDPSEQWESSQAADHNEVKKIERIDSNLEDIEKLTDPFTNVRSTNTEISESLVTSSAEEIDESKIANDAGEESAKDKRQSIRAS